MGMFKLLREGSWWITSKLEPKWDGNGRCMCGGFTMPAEAAQHVEEMKVKYGKPPDDLEYGYMKD